MHEYIARQLAGRVTAKLASNPVVAILGPRQCGKTTLARRIARACGGSVYLDLEHPQDFAKLEDPIAFFDLHRDKLICLDEIQRVPELFSVLRGVIDKQDRAGQFLILGSASQDLIRQTAESLAGRISYLELKPFMLGEVDQDGAARVQMDLWLRGGFPRSYLAEDEDASFEWRQDFASTFLERDIGMLGFHMPSARLGRFWKMCAHVHGSLLNSSKLADSLGVSSHTTRSYLDLLEQTFMVRILLPDAANLKKRLIKTPKIFIRDSGVLHGLLAIRSHDDLLSHPVRGASYEGFAIENILAHAPDWEPSFYRTRAGAEIDLILRKGRRTVAFEIKVSTTPKVSRGFWQAVEDVAPEKAYVVAPVDQPYPIKNGVCVIPLHQVPNEEFISSK